MIFAVDMGNTTIKFGVFQNNELVFYAKLATIREKTSYQYAYEIKQILKIENIDVSGVKKAILSSVVPELTDEISRAIFNVCGIFPLTVTPEVKTDIKLSIDNPNQIGADLLVSAVAVASKYPLPCFIVDFGTATKITVVTDKKEFIGGMIAPGLELSLNSLAGGASLLHSIPLKAPNKYIGANTVDCMQSGIVFGAACMVDGMIEKFKKELNVNPTVVFTGGNCNKVMPYCDEIVIFDEHLLLDGLKVIALNNEG